MTAAVTGAQYAQEKTDNRCMQIVVALWVTLLCTLSSLAVAAPSCPSASDQLYYLGPNAPTNAYQSRTLSWPVDSTTLSRTFTFNDGVTATLSFTNVTTLHRYLSSQTLTPEIDGAGDWFNSTADNYLPNGSIFMSHHNRLTGTNHSLNFSTSVDTTRIGFASYELSANPDAGSQAYIETLAIDSGSPNGAIVPRNPQYFNVSANNQSIVSTGDYSAPVQAPDLTFQAYTVDVAWQNRAANSVNRVNHGNARRGSSTSRFNEHFSSYSDFYFCRAAANATLTVNKQIIGNRANASDQFALDIRANNATRATTTTAGTGTTVSNGSVSYTGGSGITYTLRERGVSGASLTDYTSSYRCVDNSGTQVASGTGSTFNLSPQADDNITCTFTNTPKPKITLQKALATTRENSTDQFSVQIRDTNTVVNNTTNSTTTGAGATVTTGTGTTGVFRASAGTTYTLTEVAAGTSNLNNYNSRYVCTNANTSSSTVIPTTLTAGRSFNITPQVNDDITCTLTNALKPKLSISKTNNANAVAANGTTSYLVRVTNTGNVAVNGALLQDVVASNIEKTSVICSSLANNQCSANPTLAALESSGIVLPNLAPNASYEVEVFARITASSGTVTNTATVTASGESVSASDTDTVVSGTGQALPGPSCSGAFDKLYYIGNVSAPSNVHQSLPLTWSAGALSRTFTFADGVTARINFTNVSNINTNVNATSPALRNNFISAVQNDYPANSLIMVHTSPVGENHRINLRASVPTTKLGFSTYDPDEFVTTGGGLSYRESMRVISPNGKLTVNNASSYTVNASNTQAISRLQCGPTQNTGQCNINLDWNNGANANSPVTASHANEASENISAGHALAYDQFYFCVAPPPKMTLRKTLNSARQADTDQFTVQIQQAGTPVSSASNATTTGTSNLVTAGTGTTGVFTGNANTTYSLTELAAGTANLANYTSQYQCSNANASSSTSLPTSLTTGQLFNITPKRADDITCTFTNTIKPATLTLEKSLVGNRRLDTDQFTVNLAQDATTLGASTTRGVGNSIESNTGRYRNDALLPGVSYTLSETASGTTRLTDYATQYECVTTGSTTVVASGTGTTFNFTPTAGSDVTCRFINTTQPRVTLSGKVFHDNSGTTGLANTAYNGIQDAGEVGLTGVAMRLTDCASTTLARTVTAQNGSYQFQVRRDTLPANFCVVSQDLNGFRSVSGGVNGSSAYTLASDTITLTKTASNTYANNNFGDAQLTLRLTSDGQQTTTAGGTVSYAHQLTAYSVMSPTLSHITRQLPAASAGEPAWTAVVYRDANCNGAVDANDSPIAANASLGTLLPNTILCLVQRVNAPTNATVGQQHEGTLQATATVTLANGSTLTIESSQRSDLTTLGGSGALYLEKGVRTVASCPSTTTDSQTFSRANQVANAGFLEYEIRYRNRGTKNLTRIVIKDKVPTGTRFKSANCTQTPIGKTCNVTAPSVNNVGAMRWQIESAIAPNQTGTVRFCVQVD